MSEILKIINALRDDGGEQKWYEWIGMWYVSIPGSLWRGVGASWGRSAGNSRSGSNGGSRDQAMSYIPLNNHNNTQDYIYDTATSQDTRDKAL